MSVDNKYGQQLWYNQTKGKYFRVNEGKGSSKLCGKTGSYIKDFDAGLTGKYNFSQRARITADFPDDFGKVELPKAMKDSSKRVYSP